MLTVRRTGLFALLLCCSFAASAQASNVVFVCRKDLCSAGSDGSGRLRLTEDGAEGGYTSPSVSRSGKRSPTRAASADGSTQPAWSGATVAYAG